MSLVISWLLIGVAAAVNQGANWGVGVAMLVAATVLTFAPLRGREERLELWLWGAAYGMAVFSLGASLILPGRTHLEFPTQTATPAIVASQAAFAVALMLLGKPLRARGGIPWMRGVLLAAFVAAGFGGMLAIFGFPDPQIDVFYYLNEGARGFLHGLNPYAMQFSSLPVTNSTGYQDPNFHFDVYPYLPGVILLSLLTAPLGDARWLMLLSFLGTAGVLFALARRLGRSEAFAVLLAVTWLAYPGTLWVLQHAWVEPLIVLVWLLGLWAQILGNGRLAILATGLTLSLKQHTPPLALDSLAAGMNKRHLLLSALVALLVTLPFVLWSPPDFYADAVLYQIRAPARIDALSLSGWAIDQFGTTLPGWTQVGPPILVAIYGLWISLRDRSLSTALRMTAAFYLVLFVFNKFAFANYYFLAQGLLLAALAAAPGRAADLKRSAGEAPPGQVEPVAVGESPAPHPSG